VIQQLHTELFTLLLFSLSLHRNLSIFSEQKCQGLKIANIGIVVYMYQRGNNALYIKLMKSKIPTPLLVRFMNVFHVLNKRELFL